MTLGTKEPGNTRLFCKLLLVLGKYRISKFTRNLVAPSVTRTVLSKHVNLALNQTEHTTPFVDNPRNSRGMQMMPTELHVIPVGTLPSSI